MQNSGRGHRIFTPNKLDLTQAPNHCAKFHQNRIKIAAVGATTDMCLQLLMSVIFMLLLFLAIVFIRRLSFSGFTILAFHYPEL